MLDRVTNLSASLAATAAMGLLMSCGQRRHEAVGALRSVFPAPAAERLDAASLPLRPIEAVLTAGDSGDAQERIPGRLLVKLAPDQVARVFEMPSRESRVQRLVPELPRDFRVTGAREVGLSRTGRMLIRLDLAEPIPLSAARAALAQSGLRPVEELIPQSAERVAALVVWRERRARPWSFLERFEPDYPQIAAA